MDQDMFSSALEKFREKEKRKLPDSTLEKIFQNRVIEFCFETVIEGQILHTGYYYIHKLYHGNKGNPSIEDVYKILPEESPVKDMYKGSQASIKRKIDSINDGTLGQYLDAHFVENGKIVEDMTYIECFYILYFILMLLPKNDNRDEVLEVYCKYEELLPGGRIRWKQKDGIIYDEQSVEVHVVTSFEDYQKQIENMTDMGFFFRGHGDLSYINAPSLFRNRCFMQNEKEMINEVYLRCPEEFENIGMSHIEILTKMQHYGLPTRLMDITRNPFVALYFTVRDNNNLDGEVVIFKEEMKNIKYMNSGAVAILSALAFLSEDKKEEMLKNENNPNTIDLLGTIREERPGFENNIHLDAINRNVFVCPPKKNRRIMNQDGAFILCGMGDIRQRLKEEKIFMPYMTSLEDKRYKENGKKVVFVIRAKDKIKMKKKLDQMGINDTYIYPGIENTALYVKQKFNHSVGKKKQ